ncbi:MAG: Dihydrolipoamide acetyltransferase component of pyruvate dehydrogenase complex [uncultured Thermoleophilia bacterium]|uniref:Dihydrolipoamide acetyltransferase component of pyruvate dehydrogenase complex n=1 Tax=uncultured Thermoleophilia bacterium TaxID=1497501 RepID=A0A6J4TKI2_9ACTN|nr:MAG: Dihydrolipoamide acetyltransferase component of pyruvate dehydrogenase complex [uncultured Thermoleophilia bacterium]
MAYVGEQGGAAPGGSSTGESAADAAPEEAAAEPPATDVAAATDGSSDVGAAASGSTAAAGPALPGADQAATGARPAAPPAGEDGPSAPTEGRNGRTGALRVSPIARRMADDAGIDLRTFAGRGSGPDGRIVKADVERMLAEATRGAAEPAQQDAPAGTPAAAGVTEGELVQPSGMLRTVARRMAESKATVPHFYLQDEIDMGRAMDLRRELNAGLADAGEKISLNDLVVRAVARALVEHPQFHRSWTDEGLLYHPHANVGIAVALDDGLVVPVLRHADEKSVRQISAETRDLAGRARERKLKQADIEGGTFTVSNLGMFGIPNFGAIINPPEPGILAVGNAVQRAVVVDGEIVARPIMGVTLSVDHRASSGADGARFLQTVKRYLESGVLLLA